MAMVLILSIVVPKYLFELVYAARYHGTGDFCGYYNSAIALTEGKNIYDERAMNAIAWQHHSGRVDKDGRVFTSMPAFPPLLGYFFVPFIHLEYRAAAALWVFVSGVMWLLCLLLIRSVLGFEKDWMFAALMLVMALNFEPVSTHYVLGQTSILAFLFVCVLAVSVQRQHRLIAALAFAGAVVVKLNPAIFLAYFVVKKDWRTLLWCVGGLCLAALLSVWLCGMEVNGYYFVEKLPSVARGRWDRPENQSIYGFLLRLAFAANVGQGAVAMARTVSRVIGLALLVMCAVLLARKSDTNERTFALEVSLGLVVISLASPIVWSHSLTWLFFPFVAIARAMWVSPRLLTARMLLAYCVAYVLVGVLSDFYLHPLFRSGPLVWVSSAKLYGVIVLLILNVIALAGCRREGAADA